MDGQAEEWREKYHQAVDKYMQRKQKYLSKNQEWAAIFREFVVEIDRLKKEIAYVTERNLKLVELYVEGETKDV
jgi:hypothetical protein